MFVELTTELFSHRASLGLKAHGTRVWKACSSICFGKQHPRYSLLGSPLWWIETSSPIPFCHGFLFFLWWDGRTVVPLSHPSYLEIQRQVLYSLPRLFLQGSVPRASSHSSWFYCHPSPSGWTIAVASELAFPLLIFVGKIQLDPILSVLKILQWFLTELGLKSSSLQWPKCPRHFLLPTRKFNNLSPSWSSAYTCLSLLQMALAHLQDFSFAVPSVWNALPSHVERLSPTDLFGLSLSGTFSEAFPEENQSDLRVLLYSTVSLCPFPSWHSPCFLILCFYDHWFNICIPCSKVKLFAYPIKTIGRLPKFLDGYTIVGI